MNNVTLERNIETAVLTVTSVSACISFLENAAILCFIIKLLKKTNSNKDQFDFMVQICFVCANDTLSSFVLFWFAVVRVSDDDTALLCAIIVILSLTFQAMSLTTLTCMCAFRYRIAKNVRQHGVLRQSRSTAILVIVNIVMALFSLLTFLGTFKPRKIPSGADFACAYSAIVISRSSFMITVVFYILTVLFILVCDVMCLLTIYRLKREIHVAVQSETIVSTTDLSNGRQRPETMRNIVRSGQQNAIVTIILILLFFNLSVLPVILGVSLVVTGTELSASVKRVTYLFTFLNPMFNPVVIAMRVQGIRRSISKCWTRAKMGLY